MNTKDIWARVKKSIKFEDIESAGKEIGYFAFDLAEWIIIAGTGIMVSTFLGLIVYKIMAVGGIPAIFAELMASACLNNPVVPCEVNTLLGGVALTLVVLTGFSLALIRLTAYFEKVPFTYVGEDEPCKHYNAKQIKVLRTLQALGGEKNLRKFANYQEIPYSTLRNYLDQFERDGYITVRSNGKGAPIHIDINKRSHEHGQL